MGIWCRRQTCGLSAVADNGLVGVACEGSEGSVTQGCSCEPWSLVSWGEELAEINKRTVSWRLIFWKIVLPGQHTGCGKRDQGCIPCWQPDFSGNRAAGNASTGMTPQTAGLGRVQWSWPEPEANCAAEGRAGEALVGPSGAQIMSGFKHWTQSSDCNCAQGLPSWN